MVRLFKYAVYDTKTGEITHGDNYAPALLKYAKGYDKEILEIKRMKKSWIKIMG